MNLKQNGTKQLTWIATALPLSFPLAKFAIDCTDPPFDMICHYNNGNYQHNHTPITMTTHQMYKRIFTLFYLFTTLYYNCRHYTIWANLGIGLTQSCCVCSSELSSQKTESTIAREGGQIQIVPHVKFLGQL